MDITKWKSLAIKKLDHDLLTAICDKKYRAPNAMFSKLLHDYIAFQAKKLNLSIATFKKKLLSGKLKEEK